ncbi:alpha/beta fold hydrolase [Streptomyces sp. L7]
MCAGPPTGDRSCCCPAAGSDLGVLVRAGAAGFARAGHRVHAVDLVGFPGRSIPARGRRPRTVADLTTWLDAVFDGLDVTSAADLGGHSYGGWIALHYALHAPGRIRRLFLLDPTQCFAGFEDGVSAARAADAAAAHRAPGPRVPGVGDQGSGAGPRLAAPPGGGRGVPVRETGDRSPPGAGRAARAQRVGPAASGRKQQDL